MLHRYRILATLAAAAAVCVPAVLPAQDEAAFDRTPVDCLTVARIRKTDVIDDRTVIFIMGGNRIYRNYLPRVCPRLLQEDRFSYQVTGGRLCSIDRITVLSRYIPGFTCQLGVFQPITAEELAELRAIRDGLSGKDGVEVETVDPPEGAAPVEDSERKSDGEERANE